jgi:hypothetical protein
MAEILGPLGTSTSILSLVFATIPTIMKARQNYVECLDQLRRYKTRVDSCEARRETLLEKCQGFSLAASSNTESIVKEVVHLRERMTKELQRYDITQTEL